MKTRFKFGWLTLLATALCGMLQAQDFSLDWFGLAGGGGSSFSGELELSATIGQPEAGEMTGGDFAIIGGFWSIVTAVEAPGQPSLSVSLAEGTVIISWPESESRDFGLEEAGVLADPSSPWIPVNAIPEVSNGTKTVRLPLAPGNHFYRLHKP
jgi:hypothetical protein